MSKPEPWYYLMLASVALLAKGEIKVVRVSDIVALVCFLILLKEAIINKRKLVFPGKCQMALICLFLALAVVSMSLSFNLPLRAAGLVDAVGAKRPHVRAIVQTLKLGFGLLMFYWMTLNVVRSRHILVKSVVAVVAGSVLAASWGLYLDIGHLLGFDTALEFKEPGWIVARLNATGKEPLVFANFLLVTIPLTFFLANNFKSRDFSWAIWFFLYIQMLAMILTFSAGGWVGMLVVFGVYLLLKPAQLWKSKLKITLVVLALIITIAGLNTFYPVGKGFVAIAPKFVGLFSSSIDSNGKYYSSLYSGVDRTLLMKTGLIIFAEHPYFGIGLGNFGYLYNDFRPAGTPEKDAVTIVNNQYIEVLTEMGIFGFIVYMSLLTVLLWQLYQLFRKKRNSLDGEFLTAGLAGIMAILVQYLTFTNLSSNYFWILVGLAMSLTIPSNTDAGSRGFLGNN